MEKIVKGLECCITDGTDCPNDCPYLGECNRLQLHTDALGMLESMKSFESIVSTLHLCDSCAKIYPECDATKDGVIFGTGVGNDNIVCCDGYVNCRREPVNATIGGSANNCWWHACGNCNEPIDKGDKFCRHCGRAVKWE